LIGHLRQLLCQSGRKFQCRPARALTPVSCRRIVLPAAGMWSAKPLQQYNNDKEDWDMIGDNNDVNNGCASESFKFIRVSIMNCTHCLLPPLPLLLLPVIVRLAACCCWILSLALVHRPMLLSRQPPSAAHHCQHHPVTTATTP
jgi:hypothetical protein